MGNNTNHTQPEEEPKIFGIHINEKNHKQFTRRDFLKVTATVGTAAALSSCDFPEDENKEATQIAELEQELNNSEATLAAVEAESMSKAEVSSFTGNLYAGPGDFHPTTTHLSHQADLTILSQNTDGSWYLVETSRGSVGWVSAEDIEIVKVGSAEIPVAEHIPTQVEPTATNTPQPTATDKPQPTATRTTAPTKTAVPAANDETFCKGVVNMSHTIWAGPDSNHKVLGKTKLDAEVEIIGKTQDDNWFKIYTSDNITGWVYSTFITLSECELWEITVPYNVPTQPAPPCDCDSYGSCDCDSYAACSCDSHDYTYCSCDEVHYWYPN